MRVNCLRFTCMPKFCPTAPTANWPLRAAVSLRQVPSLATVLLILFTLFLGGGLVTYKLEQLSLDFALKEQHEATLREASLLASRIEAETNSTFYLVVGLARLIEINGGISQQHFNEICEQLMISRPGLRNIAAAPDLVIQYIYPLKGNEAALGLDYRTTPTQKDATYQVMATGQPVIAGPLTLVQGGEAFVGRFPVYIQNTQTGKRDFWGIISTPFDTAQLYKETGLLDSSLGIEISLRGHDSQGSAGKVFFGTEAIYDKMPVNFPIELISGSWEMAALPKGGWLKVSPDAGYIRFIGFTLTLLLVILLCLLYLYVLRSQRSSAAEREVLRLKARFYANMSHELRTPLNGICGLSEIIQLSSEDPEICADAKMILESAETLTRLLDDVLVLSEANQAHAPKTTLTLEPFLTKMLPPLLHEAKSKQLTFTVEPIPEKCTEIQTNPAMLRQILWNLLSNAVKFTKSGTVSLRVEPHSSQTLCFIVSDTGIGIAAEHLEQIFYDFFQEDDGDTRTYRGAGLGLAVVKRFVENLNGTVTVTSETGVGSTFTVTLPNRY